MAVVKAQTIKFKQGATFSVTGYTWLPTGTVWSATSQVRDLNDNVIQDLNVTLVAPAGSITVYTVTLEADAVDTQTWPLGSLQCDVMFSDTNGIVMYTQTFYILVLQEVTQ